MRIFHRAYLFVSFISVFYCATGANAKILSFKPGDKASYTIYQSLDAELERENETKSIRSEGKLTVDIEIISSDPETQSYPYDVKVTLKKLVLHEMLQDGFTSAVIAYDSGDQDLPQKGLSRLLSKLIDTPLHFKVDKDFQVTETTRRLHQTFKHIDSPSPLGLFGTTPWTFNLLLSQLFHLSGRQLRSDASYTVKCGRILQWEEGDESDDHSDERHFCTVSDDDVNEIDSDHSDNKQPNDDNKPEIIDPELKKFDDPDSSDEESEKSEIRESGGYVITGIDSNKIEGALHVTGKLVEREWISEGDISGKVVWNAARPIIQTRSLQVKLEGTETGSDAKHVKMTIRQTREPNSP